MWDMKGRGVGCRPGPQSRAADSLSSGGWQGLQEPGEGGGVVEKAQLGPDHTHRPGRGAGGCLRREQRASRAPSPPA